MNITKVAVFADTHGTINDILKNYNNEIDIDLVILLGDIYRYELKIIDNMFNVPIIGVYGNHDNSGMYDETNIVDINKKMYIFNGMHICGLQGSLRYKESQEFGYTQKESIAECKSLPKCDLLISHDAPYKYGTCRDDAHMGLKGLYKYIKKNKPKTLLFGHHHKNRYIKIKDTNCYNVYGLSIFNFIGDEVSDWRIIG